MANFHPEWARRLKPGDTLRVVQRAPGMVHGIGDIVHVRRSDGHIIDLQEDFEARHVSGWLWQRFELVKTVSFKEIIDGLDFKALSDLIRDQGE